MLISILILADSLFGNLTLERSKAQEDPLKLRIASLLFPHPPSLGLSRRLALGVPAQPLTPLHSPRSRSRCTPLQALTHPMTAAHGDSDQGHVAKHISLTRTRHFDTHPTTGHGIAPTSTRSTHGS
jgi:hypothetical protein